jgi:membrane-anchored protein YejM (alkaline phosphatase superfamily)
VTADMDKDIGLIMNRYINSCNHLDTQFGRVIDYLQEKGLLDSTIVVMTGDHGEEFMETGRWGHNSNFTDWQTLVPMVLWAPGMEHGVVKKMTSHLDLPATILKKLGVTNDPADYSLGFDMLGDHQREYLVMGDWDKIVCVDGEYKATFAIRSALGTQELTTRDDKDATGQKDAYYQSRQQMLLNVMREMKAFGG